MSHSLLTERHTVCFPLTQSSLSKVPSDILCLRLTRAAENMSMTAKIHIQILILIHIQGDMTPCKCKSQQIRGLEAAPECVCW